MKELSVEEKAKRYDEAYKKVAVRFGSNVANEIFLKESKDEMIRKGLINGFKFYSDQEYWGTEKFPLKIKDVIAWLEKQGDKKEKQYITITQKILDYISKYKYKFENNIPKLGDSWKVIEICKYPNVNNGKPVVEVINEGNGDWMRLPLNIVDIKIEQKPAFEMKTPEESMGIDSETYSKIVDECIYCEQKPAWTPMDEQRVENILSIIEGHGYPGEVAWLKSLKDRIQPKQEWSEEDKNMLQSILNEYKSMPTEKRNWLKSLKERSTWKPSDEQMNALSVAVKHGQTDDPDALKKLLEQLKKLREE